LVALKLLGDAELWWRILDFNPEINDPVNIVGGTVLRIPNE
jgi:prophage DNA circulation protein